MQPKIRVILEEAIEKGVRYGYSRAYKHATDPSDETVMATIEDAVMSSIYEYFTFAPDDFG